MHARSEGTQDLKTVLHQTPNPNPSPDDIGIAVPGLLQLLVVLSAPVA